MHSRTHRAEHAERRRRVRLDFLDLFSDRFKRDLLGMYVCDHGATRDAVRMLSESFRSFIDEEH